ncbi:MAG: class I SAM-dependent methyltransferase [marine benthic group bacterium]|jgi:SAM-dependent methyltransferase|nr:class I SAM-dependent methyltransferase [Gemmatimonadota bacterium]MCL7962542.1 class I SAM-dependent methyltransferase [Candidatus Carthagonibacter metallireducens]MCL7968452.1 class I SAM-dependent methyltransferase [Gemmatimonadota bacterium]MCL7973267.1 class I SAM-dependent methyltransferase [Gemmatimonadota bacterium]MCL7978663.1 class I SAM-dependent methyltransferase [Gemmatimonadota bacterium]
MTKPAFDEYAEAYDAWFLENRTILESEVRLIRNFLERPGRTLSVGCGTGLFELILREEHGIEVGFGVEPSDDMRAIAAKRGLEVEAGTAESLPYEDASFDTALLNGIPGYVADLERAFSEAYRILRPGGAILVADVPAESSFGLLYQFAATKGAWDDPALAGLAPAHPYPVELAAAAHWRTTEEKAQILERVGFVRLEYAQTLTVHARFANDFVEEPIEGYDRGDYVLIRAYKE